MDLSRIPSARVRLNPVMAMLVLAVAALRVVLAATLASRTRTRILVSPVLRSLVSPVLRSLAHLLQARLAASLRTCPATWGTALGHPLRTSGVVLCLRPLGSQGARWTMALAQA